MSLDVTTIVSLVSASTALVAVVVSPIVTLRRDKLQRDFSLGLALRQINASVVSQSRREWIDELRDSIAEFQSLVNYPTIQGALMRDDAADKKLSRALFLRHRIALLINPDEIDAKGLLNRLDETLSVAGCAGPDAAGRMMELAAETTNLARSILKREWIRVRQGEPISESPSLGEGTPVRFPDTRVAPARESNAD